ncbi:hypothetical protein [Tomitella gaofuii]|uniref:hypothetical protein n=1 Tax=Tomitella gaofuii TaxID=2760083 RepID=UPI0015FC1717|nr:hypothetical protein [Tomitella gaofuii]
MHTPTPEQQQPPSTAPAAVPPKQRRHLYLWAVAAAIVTAIIAVPIGYWILHDDGADAFPMSGTISLNGSSTTFGTPTGFDCVGDDGYDDLDANSGVSVRDASGTLIAKGAMTGSSKAGGYCVLSFLVPDVPTGNNYYLLELSHRGELSFTEDEAQEPISLSLG